MVEVERWHHQCLEAARLGDVAAVAALLDQGMAVDAGNAGGSTALMRAAAWNQLDVVRLLLDRGADPNLTNAEGYSAMTFAIGAAWYKGHVEVLPLLTAAGGRRQTLPDAVWSGDVELARTLLDAGADVNLGKWSHHGTMLQIASLRGDLAILDLLLACGPDPEARDDIEGRPLTVAAERGHIEVVRRLLDYGADIDVVDQFGMSALSHASEKGDRPLYDLLIARGAKIRMLDALNEGDLVKFEQLLDEQLKEDGDVDHISRWGGRRLAAYAAKTGDVAVLRMALDRGAVLFHDLYDDISPLALAAKGGHIAAMELLLSRGDDPNRPAFEGRTPLALALKEGRDEAVALLKRAGAVV